MTIREVKCDYCSRTKGESNHWYRVNLGRQGFLAYKSETELEDDEYRDYCSDKCITLAFSNWLNLKDKQ